MPDIRNQDTPSLIDCHCHLMDPRLAREGPLSEVIGRAAEGGVGRFLMASSDPDDWVSQLEIQSKFGSALPSFGLHPWYVARSSAEQCVQSSKKLEASLENAVALGEVGLDFGGSRDNSSWYLQMEVFQKQIAIAKNFEKPIVVHAVKSHHAVLPLLSAAGPQKGFIHGFSGSFEVAKGYVDKGFYLSIGTGILRDNADKIREVIKRVPVDYLLVESDSPDGFVPAGMNVDEMTEEFNEPKVAAMVAREIAGVLGISFREFSEQISSNFERLIGQVND